MNSAEHEEGGTTTITPPIRASMLLRVRNVWLAPIGLAAVLVFFITLFYIGAVVNPAGHLSGLPVALVNQDRGETVQGHQVNFGAEVASDLQHSHAVTSRLALDEVSLAQARTQMNSNNASAAIVIPADFTASLLSAYGLASASAGQPAIQQLTNPRAGSVGCSWPPESPSRPCTRCRSKPGASSRRRPPGSAASRAAASAPPIPSR